MTALVLLTKYPTGLVHPCVCIQGYEDRLYCGQSYCKGECGYPALMLTMPDGRELKAHSSMVAAGPAWKQKAWDGARVQVRELFPALDPNKAVEMWWP